MAKHQFSLLTQTCVGCDMTARDAEDQLSTSCPAYYGEIADRGEKLRLVIRTDEELRVFRPDGMPKFSLDQHAMFELRDHIDEGVRKLREAKGE